MKRTTIYLDEKLHKRVHLECVKEEVSFSSVVVELLELWLSGKKAPRGK